MDIPDLKRWICALALVDEAQTMIKPCTFQGCKVNELDQCPETALKKARLGLKYQIQCALDRYSEEEQ